MSRITNYLLNGDEEFRFFEFSFRSDGTVVIEPAAEIWCGSESMASDIPLRYIASDVLPRQIVINRQTELCGLWHDDEGYVIKEVRLISSWRPGALFVQLTRDGWNVLKAT